MDRLNLSQIYCSRGLAPTVRTNGVYAGHFLHKTGKKEEGKALFTRVGMGLKPSTAPMQLLASPREY